MGELIDINWWLEIVREIDEECRSYDEDPNAALAEVLPLGRKSG